jgi:hypothetical protein
MVDEQIASGSLDDDKTETMSSRWLMNMYLLYVESMKQFYLKKNLLLSSMDLSWMYLNLEVKRH